MNNCPICQKETLTKFCSHTCAGRYGNQKRLEKRGNPTIWIDCKCFTCDKNFSKKISEVRKTQRDFCSKSCAAQTNNKIYPKRQREIQNQKYDKCIFCNKPSRYPNKYCDNCHKQGGKSLFTIRDWLAGDNPGGSKYSISDTIRNYLLQEANNKCSKCGWGEINPFSGKIALEINHIDGNGSNHHPSNVEVICANCHSLTSNYRGLNRGKGRGWVYHRKSK